MKLNSPLLLLSWQQLHQRNGDGLDHNSLITSAISCAGWIIKSCSPSSSSSSSAWCSDHFEVFTRRVFFFPDQENQHLLHCASSRCIDASRNVPLCERDHPALPVSIRLSALRRCSLVAFQWPQITEKLGFFYSLKSTLSNPRPLQISGVSTSFF